MTTKHTPGPWYAVEGTVFKDYGDKAYPVASVEGWGEDTDHNARLIAAAPDLLNFAKLVLRGLESGVVKAKPIIDVDPDAEQVDMRPLASIARAAIAKAEGQQ